MTPSCYPTGTQTLVARQEGQSLCCSSPWTDSNISLFPDLHRLSTYSRQVSSSPWSFLPALLSTTDLPTTLTQPQHYNSKSSVCPETAFSRRQLVLFLKRASMTSNCSHFLPKWPQPPVQTLNRTPVLVKLDPQTQTVNFCVGQMHKPANVSAIFLCSSDS